tara:strand:- start:739 stop:1455 length:717 start_codon:yes stop_codon:yes gene_type:complete
MKLAIIGYGKMGKEIEKIALERNHEVILKIDSKNTHLLTDGSLAEADAAIEFSKPEKAVENILACFEAEVPVAVGTTGWYKEWEEVQDECESQDACLLTATNFSVGVNLFFELNRKLAQLISKRGEYKAQIKEIHHTQKLDSPSGTAISLADDLIERHPAYSKWVNEESKEESSLEILSYRESSVPGTHEIIYDSSIDEISIKHTAKNRKGFALGSVLAAEFIQNKIGIYTMKDVLNF